MEQIKEVLCSELDLQSLVWLEGYLKGEEEVNYWASIWPLSKGVSSIVAVTNVHLYLLSSTQRGYQLATYDLSLLELSGNPDELTIEFKCGKTTDQVKVLENETFKELLMALNK